jgi:leader peptidase (prepilin peptidase) / N-methyltransferase
MKLDEASPSRNPMASLIAPLAAVAWLWLWLMQFGWLDLTFGAVLLLCAADIVISDWEIMIVPDRSVVAMFVAGWVYALAASGWDWGGMLGWRGAELLLQSVILGGGAWLLTWLYRLLRRRDGLGLGDVKLIGAAGAWLSVEQAANALTLAALAALLWLAALNVLRGTRAAMSQAIPFAVFLAPAFWLLWAYGR